MKKIINKNAMTPSQSLSRGEPKPDQIKRSVLGRRSFLMGLGATSAMLLPASVLLAPKVKAAEDDGGGKLSKGDASILRFLCAAEILESDLWEQYWELGGNQAADFASHNPAPPGVKPTPTEGSDPMNQSTVTFTDLHASTDENLQANLIMPEPTPFLNRKFPICSIIRPTETKGVAMASAQGLAADGLFMGQTPEFFQLLADLATDADQARREGAH